MDRYARGALAGLAVAFVAWPCLGCAGEGDEKEALTYTIPVTTTQVPAGEAVSVLDLEDDGATIVLATGSALADGVQVGDVLMFGDTPRTPNGLLRKVASVTATAAGVSLVTTEATMEEAFEELDLELVRDLEYDDLDELESTVEGLAIRRSPLRGSAGFAFELGFQGTVLHDADNNPATTGDQVVIDGSVSFSLQLNVGIHIKWFTVRYLEVGIAAAQDGKLSVTSTLAGLQFQKEKVVGTLKFPTIWVGGVVPIKPRLDLIVGVNGDFRVQVVTSVSEHLGASAGAIYERGKGWRSYTNFESNWEFQPPTLSASAEVKAYVGPRLSLLIFNAAGPYAQVTAYLDLQADTTRTPWWELFAGFDGALGIQGKVFGVEFLKFQLDIPGPRYRIAHADIPTCEADCAGRECGPDPVCGTSCGACSMGETCQDGTCEPEVVVAPWEDPATGLTWESTPNPNVFGSDAMMRCGMLGEGWRLPTIDELRTLVRGCPQTATGGACGVTDACVESSCRDEANCAGCAANGGPSGGCYWPEALAGTCGWYWSSSTAPIEPAWAVDFTTGGVGRSQTAMAWVRCVQE